jgi:hypothetical protein
MKVSWKSIRKKLRWNYALITLLAVFGTLYIVGNFFGNIDNFVQTWISPSADLWANLFASLITVLFIEKIIHRERIQKNEQSIKYVKGQLFTVLAELMDYARTPSNWKENLANPEYDWEPYRNKLACGISFSVKKLENIIDCYRHLLEPEIMNDIFVLASVLRVPIFDVSEAITKSVAFISESKKLIERHELTRYMGMMMRFRQGEPPKIQLGLENSNMNQYLFSEYSKRLDEAIKFRDEYREKYKFKRLQKS